MDLKQQYQTEMQHIAPSEEQCERIRTRVYEELQKPQKAKKRKKPLSLKAIAITGASAACLVLAATFAFRFTHNGIMLENAKAGSSLDCNVNDIGAAAAKPSIECYDGNAGGGMDTTADHPVSAPGKSLQTESSAFGRGADLRIEFSEDLSECVVYSGSEARTYALSNEAELTVDYAQLLTEIPEDGSNLGEELFVRIENGKIWIYDRNKEFLGAFVETA